VIDLGYGVWVGRDLLATFEEAAALAFMAEQFDRQVLLTDAWLEVDTGARSAQLVRGDQLLKRISAVHPTDKLSA
jgi:hypothetical protein